MSPLPVDNHTNDPNTDVSANFPATAHHLLRPPTHPSFPIRLFHRHQGPDHGSMSRSRTNARPILARQLTLSSRIMEERGRMWRVRSDPGMRSLIFHLMGRLRGQWRDVEVLGKREGGRARCVWLCEEYGFENIPEEMNLSSCITCGQTRKRDHRHLAIADRGYSDELRTMYDAPVRNKNLPCIRSVRIPTYQERDQTYARIRSSEQ